MNQTTDPHPQSGPDIEPLKEELQRTGDELNRTIQDIKGDAIEKGHQMVDEKSTKAGETIGAVAEASSAMKERLREQDQDWLAQGVEKLEGGLNNAAEYLRNSNPDEIMEDLRVFSSRNPAITIAGLLGLGLLAGRALKASSAPQPRQSLSSPSPEPIQTQPTEHAAVINPTEPSFDRSTTIIDHTDTTPEEPVTIETPTSNI